MTVARILSALSSSNIVLRIEISDIVIEPPVQSLRARAHLIKGHLLYITESIGDDWRSYSYHLQKDNKMIMRWDNAPHWKELKTYPCHVHLSGQRKPKPCDEVFIEEVLAEIEGLLGR